MFKEIFVFISVLAHIQPSLELSSFVQTKNNYRLDAHIMKRQRTSGILECAHRCRLQSACDSFNYENTAANQGICELHNYMAGVQHSQDLMYREGCIFGLLKSTENVDFTFTTLGAVGGEGPQNTSGYLGTPLEGKVQLQDGTQIWEVPETGTYEIEARGASGANGTNSSDPKVWKLGGRGARIRGQFYLRRGTKLKILVGQRGSTIPISLTQPGTGGGGSFVTTMDNEPLIIAGGGGGGASPSPGWEDGDPGQAGRNGSQHGGTEGSGGKLFKDGVAVFLAGAGGGLLTDGQGTVVPVLVKGGQSFLGGGRGGRNSAVDDGKGFGGFGGGGGANADPGGGGGFSGGGVTKTKNLCKAGGGGSYNGGTQQINKAGFNKGDGQVSIKLL